MIVQSGFGAIVFGRSNFAGTLGISVSAAVVVDSSTYKAKASANSPVIVITVVTTPAVATAQAVSPVVSISKTLPVPVAIATATAVAAGYTVGQAPAPCIVTATAKSPTITNTLTVPPAVATATTVAPQIAHIAVTSVALATARAQNPVPYVAPNAPPAIANTSAVVLGRTLGVTLAWTTNWQNDLDAYAAMVERMPALYSWFCNFANSFPSATTLNTIYGHGTTPFVTLEPWDGVGTSDPTYKLSNITRGDFDAWLITGAQQAAAYGRVFYVRFAPEFNGNWAPWGAGVNGNTAQDFINAWNHVRNLFIANGATNVRWVWAPNVISGPAVNFTPYYPGSGVVDVLALDGYNWGSTLGTWQTYTQIFGTSYDTIAALDAVKPVMITEMASAETGGDKAAWITSTYMTEIPSRTPRVTAVLWFNENKETDWRVESSTASLTAYKAVVASPSWQGYSAVPSANPTIYIGADVPRALATATAANPVASVSITRALPVAVATATAVSPIISISAVTTVALATATATSPVLLHLVPTTPAIATATAGTQLQVQVQENPGITDHYLLFATGGEPVTTTVTIYSDDVYGSGVLGEYVYGGIAVRGAQSLKPGAQPGRLLSAVGSETLLQVKRMII